MCSLRRERSRDWRLRLGWRVLISRLRGNCRRVSDICYRWCGLRTILLGLGALALADSADSAVLRDCNKQYKVIIKDHVTQHIFLLWELLHACLFENWKSSPPMNNSPTIPNPLHRSDESIFQIPRLGRTVYRPFSVRIKDAFGSSDVIRSSQPSVIPLYPVINPLNLYALHVYIFHHHIHIHRIQQIEPYQLNR